MKMKLAILQKKSLDRQVEKNTETVIEAMKEAAGQKADILLLPEAFLTGYQLPLENREALSDDSPYIRKVCDDREYPESARVLMMKGAEIILVPNDCTAMKPRIGALSTRAYENMTGVAMANPNGENAGNSCAFSPICWDENGNCVDNVLLMADAETEGLFYAEFDMDAIRNYREHEMMGNTYRKVKVYRALMDDKIEAPFLRENQGKRD